MVSRNSVGGHARIENHRDVGVLRDARQKRAHDRGLAGSHLARQLYEAARFVDAIEQMSQRLGVPLAQVQIARVRRDREGLFDEAEKARVHGGGDNTKLSRGADRSRRRSAAADLRESAPASRSGRGYRRWRQSSRETRAAPSANRSGCRTADRSPVPTPSNRNATFPRPASHVRNSRCAPAHTAAVSCVGGSRTHWRVYVVKSARRIFTVTRPAERPAARRRAAARSASAVKRRSSTAASRMSCRRSPPR